MNSLPQIWDVPITDYLFFYLIFGTIAFVLCFIRRFFITAIIPLLLWFCIADMRSFFRQDVGSKKLGPEGDYIFIVAVLMLIAFSFAILGTYLNWRNNRFKVYDND